MSNKRNLPFLTKFIFNDLRMTGKPKIWALGEHYSLQCHKAGGTWGIYELVGVGSRGMKTPKKSWESNCSKEQSLNCHWKESQRVQRRSKRKSNL